LPVAQTTLMENEEGTNRGRIINITISARNMNILTEIACKVKQVQTFLSGSFIGLECFSYVALSSD